MCKSLQAFIHDTRLALRNTLAQPALSMLIIVTLALAIGVNTAMFSAAWQVLAAPLPYVDGDRLLMIKQHIPGKGRQNTFWSLPTFNDLRTQSTLLADVAGYEQQSLPLIRNGEPVSALAGIVSANYFDLLGITPLLGRPFAAGDDMPGARPVLMLSQRFWSEAFNSDPSVIGDSLSVYGVEASIIGVLPPMPPYPKDNDIWLTHAGNAYSLLSSAKTDDRNGYWFEHVLARVRQPATLSSVAAELSAIAARLEQAYPDIYLDNYALEAVPLQQEIAGEAGPAFLLLQTMTLLVLVIAAANVGGLTLARLAGRHQALAIHEAVGASPARLRRMLLIESLLLAVAGGAAGLLIVRGSVGLMRDFTAEHTALASEIGISAAVLTFALVVSVLAGLLSSLAPAFSRRNVNAALKEGGDKVTTAAGLMRRRQLLLMLQYALAFVVMTSAGLAGFSLYRLASQDAGFETEGVLAISLLFRVDLTRDSAQFKPQMAHFSRELKSRVEMLPQVTAAGFYGGTPLLDDPLYELAAESLEIDGGSPQLQGPYAFARIRLASGSFFEVMNMRLLQGRFFNEADEGNAAKVAIVNSSFASHYFPDGNAVGRRIRIAPYDTEWSTIVGVVSDVRGSALQREEGDAFYLNYEQHYGDIMNLYVKARGNLAELGQRITGIIQQLEPGQPVDSVRPLNELRRSSLAPASLRTLLVILFGALALIVTLTGVVGVLTNHINQQRRQTAIRMAVGATPSRITASFIARGMATYAMGLLTGVLLMLFLAPLLQPLLYQTDPFEPAIYLASACVLTLAVALAMYPPARKAASGRALEVLHET